MTAVAAASEQLNLSAAIADGFRLIGRRPMTMLALAACLGLAPAIANAWASGQLAQTTHLPELWKPVGEAFAASFAAVGVNWVLQGGVALLAAADAPSYGSRDEPPLSLLARRAGWLFVAGVASNIAVSLGTLALIVPGLLLGLAWCSAPAVSAVEGRSLLSMWRRSADLTRGHRGALFGLFVGYFAMRAAVSYGTRLALGLPLQPLSAGPGWIVFGLQPAVSTCFTVIYAAVMASVYLELRRLHDGGVAGTFD